MEILHVSDEFNDHIIILEKITHILARRNVLTIYTSGGSFSVHGTYAIQAIDRLFDCIEHGEEVRRSLKAQVLRDKDDA